MKTFVVTGASRGIGLATAHQLIVLGHRVIGLSRSKVPIDEGLQFRSVRCDLETSDPQSVLSSIVDRLSNASPDQRSEDSIDGVVLNAAIAEHRSMGEWTPELFARHFQMNTVGPLLLARGFADLFLSRGTRGSLVFVSSTLAQRPTSDSAAYAASKAALNAGARAMALSLAPHEIRVNIVSPGIVDTALLHSARPGGEAKGATTVNARDLDVLQPLGRMGQPADIASAIVYLLLSEYSVGTDLIIDGGLTL